MVRGNPCRTDVAAVAVVATLVVQRIRRGLLGADEQGGDRLVAELGLAPPEARGSGPACGRRRHVEQGRATEGPPLAYDDLGIDRDAALAEPAQQRWVVVVDPRDPPWLADGGGCERLGGRLVEDALGRR